MNTYRNKLNSQALRWIGGIAMLGIVSGGLHSTTVFGQIQITGSLANFDVRYPRSQPNDIEIYLYGDDLTPADVVNTWNTDVLLGGVGLQWGRGEVEDGGVVTDPTSPAFGLDCIIVRYKGESRPDLVGQMVHLGVRLRIGKTVLHQEVWWTFNGIRLTRPCDPHISWICSRTHQIVCIANPTPNPMYIYGCRWFPVPDTVRLPRLTDLTFGINPEIFGSQWNPVQLPGPARVFCLQPWCRIYLRIPIVRWRPVIFQLAARNIPEDADNGNPIAFPLPIPREQLPDGPIPDDFDDFGEEGEFGTMAILTTRATHELPGDTTGPNGIPDGVVGIPDFNEFRSLFGAQSEDMDNVLQ